jgi:TrmH family RNA methyltransferase
MPPTSKNSTAPLKPLKWYKKLSTRKGRREARAFLVEGERAIRQIICSRPGAILEIITVEGLPHAHHDYALRVVTESQFHTISSVRTPQGIMAVVRLPEETYSSNLPEHTGNRILLLEDIQDPGNVGTLIRTAAAFDYCGVILTEKCADPFSPKCIQSAAGSILSVWLRRTDRYLELVNELREKGYYLVATDLYGLEDPSILCHQNKLVLTLGNEASGLSEAVLKAADYRLSIPTIREKAESLNVAVCGAICMYLSCSQNR